VITKYTFVLVRDLLYPTLQEQLRFLLLLAAVAVVWTWVVEVEEVVFSLAQPMQSHQDQA
jgi:hypothetical protein